MAASRPYSSMPRPKIRIASCGLKGTPAHGTPGSRQASFQPRTTAFHSSVETMAAALSASSTLAAPRSASG